MNLFPKHLVISVTQPMRWLDNLADNDELPVLDLDAIASSLIELLERPSLLTGRQLDDAVTWLLEANGLSSAEVGEELGKEAKSCFYACLIIMRQDLQTLNPYTDGQLLYRYKERHGDHAVILERLPLPGA